MQTQDETQARELTERATELASEAREQVEEAAENLLETIADQLEEFADKLRKEDLGSLLEHVRGAAERSPELFFAGSVVTGLMLARFLKSSGQRRARAGSEWSRSESERQPRLSPPSESARSMSLPMSSPSNQQNPELTQ
jgi:hypothetical protein